MPAQEQMHGVSGRLSGELKKGSKKLKATFQQVNSPYTSLNLP